MKMWYDISMLPTEPKKAEPASQSLLNTPIEKNNFKLYMIGAIAFALLLFVGIAYVLYQPSFNQDLSENESESDSVLDTTRSDEVSTDLQNLEELKTVDESVVEVVRNDDGNATKGILSGVKIGEWFIKNDKNIYLITPPDSDGGPSSSLAATVDTNSFSDLENGFYKDKAGIYYLSIREGLTLVLEKLVGIDPATFDIFNHGSFIRDKNGVHLYNRVGTLVLLPDLDQTTFQTVNTVYVKDKNGMYALKTINGGQRTGLHAYKILDADSSKFQLIEARGYYLKDRLAKDSRFVYYAGAKIPLADPSSFQVLNEIFVYDRMHVYTVIPDGGPVPENNTTGYDQLVLLEGVEAKNFRLLHDSYATDGIHVFTKYRADAVRGADAKTFESYKDQWGADARDANHVYSDGSIILYLPSIPDDRLKIWEANDGPDGNTRYSYVTDGLYVYYSAYDDWWGSRCEKEYPNKEVKNYCLVELVEGADPATFQRVEGTDYWKDKNSRYLKGEKA